MTRLLLTFLGVMLLVTARGRDARAQVAAQDSLALVALYNATNGPNWIDHTNWLGEPVSQWNGVTVTGDRVTSLDLSVIGLIGPIPPELGDLTNLTHLRFSFNDLTGPIPPELGNLANLTSLELFENKITGSIPPELGKLATLTGLSLNANDLTGSIPPELGNLANLTSLLLAGNDLAGSIPPELSTLANLTLLSLLNNDLTGSIPSELGTLTNLTDLRLDGNDLTGSIPPELGDLANLTDLRLDGNDLTGSIPSELGNLTNLIFLDLAVNQLTGSIPPELGNLANLRDLTLSSNPLSGTLPLSLTNLSMLHTFYFDNTNLCEPTDDAFQAWLQDISNVLSTGCTAVPTEEVAEIPAAFALEANYPNPFNPSTTIRYALPQPAAVRLSVYDVQGRLVAVLAEAEQATGWHEVTFEVGALPSGVYFYRLEAGTFRAVHQMLLLR